VGKDGGLAFVGTQNRYERTDNKLIDLGFLLMDKEGEVI
jgi:hypothetical protein